MFYLKNKFCKGFPDTARAMEHLDCRNFLNMLDNETPARKGASEIVLWT